MDQYCCHRVTGRTYRLGEWAVAVAAHMATADGTAGRTACRCGVSGSWLALTLTATAATDSNPAAVLCVGRIDLLWVD